MPRCAMHTTANGRAYKKYTGPKGERASSLKQARRPAASQAATRRIAGCNPRHPDCNPRHPGCTPIQERAGVLTPAGVDAA